MKNLLMITNKYMLYMRKNMKNMLDLLNVKCDILQNEERLCVDNYDLGNFRNHINHYENCCIYY